MLIINVQWTDKAGRYMPEVLRKGGAVGSTISMSCYVPGGNVTV